MKYRHTPEFQRVAVSALLQHPTLLAEVRDAISPEYFELATHTELIRIATEFYDVYRARPNRDTLMQLLYDKAIKLSWRPQDRDAIVKELFAVFSAPLAEADTKYVQKVISDFGRIQAVKLAMMKSVQTVTDFEKGEDVNVEDIEKCIKQALTVGASKNIGIDLSSSISRIPQIIGENPLSSDDRRVATGFPSIDRYLGGGLGGGELGFIIAPSNKGKSMFLVNLAAAAVRQSRRAVYFTFEMKEPDVLARIAANLTDVEIHKAQRGDPEFYAKLQQYAYVVQDKKLRIIYIKPSDATANNLRSVLMRIDAMEGWSPQIIIVDYMDEMNTGSKRNSDDDMYNAYGQVAADLLDIGVDYKCPVWTASQVNREGYIGEPGLSTTGRSMQKIDKAEVVVTPIQTETQAKQGKMVLKLIKNRRGPVNVKIPCISDLAKARIVEEASPFQ